MYFRYGSYTHPANEVNLTSFEAFRIFNERGKQESVLYRLHATGEILETGQSDLHAAIAARINAYSVQNQDVGLLHDDGTPTSHYLRAADPDTLTGVRIVRHAWPKGDPAEYATQRTFYMVFEAEHRRLESQIVGFHESVQVIGGGPRIRGIEFEVGPPLFVVLNQQTISRVEQVGFMEGFDFYPDPGLIPAPIFPGYNLRDLTRVRREAPRLRGIQATNYRVAWSYVMETPIQDLVAFPNIFPSSV